MSTFLPYAPPSSLPTRSPDPDGPTAAERRLNRALAAIMWAFAIGVIFVARYALSSTTAIP